MTEQHSHSPLEESPLENSQQKATLGQLLKNRDHWLTFLALVFERFIYYGFRSFLVFFLTDTIANGGLELSETNALATYGTFTIAVYIGMLCGGIISDITQKHLLIYSGGFIALMIGFVWFSQSSAASYFVPLMVIGFATGVTHVSLFTRFAHIAQRIPQFSLNLFASSQISVSLGALFAPIIIGMTADNYGYQYGLILCCLLAILPLLTLLIAAKNSNVQDFDQTNESKEPIKMDAKAVFILLTVIILSGGFTVINEVVSAEHSNLMQQTGDLMMIVLAAFPFVIFMFIGLFAFHLLFNVSPNNLAIGFISLAIFGYLTQLASTLNDATNLLMIAAVIIAMGEILVATSALALVSKYAKAKYMGSAIGLLFIVEMLFDKSIAWSLSIENGLVLATQISVAIGVLIVIATLLIKKQQKSQLTSKQ